MSNQHYGYHNDGRHSQAQAEVDDLLNSLVNQSNVGT
jgi:hypothetical protein